ncbi:uncharacterized protein LOC143300796 [Babylonia areolata]|uniref:uncharacterized protein LOC143300796 n=1 Tax=Babylonia areolata TaxID=304850 RepID=UPI003FD2B341
MASTWTSCLPMALLLPLLFLLLSVHLPYFARAARLTHDNQARLDRFVRQVMHCGDIQALSVSLVGDGGVVYERGYDDTRYLPPGLKRRGIGKDTVFCLGGSTQAFTSVLLATLLDTQENHTMDSPVHQITGSTYHLPGHFRTQRINLKDILGMRTGLSNMDIVAVAKGMDRYRLMQNLRFAPEVRQFRDETVYNEVLFSLAEDAARALGGETWYQLMRQHIFTPLGMSNAGFVHTDAQDSSRVAPPYLKFRGNHHPVPWDAYKGQEVVAAATSVCASASDMSKWMHFILSGGKTLNNQQLVREKAIQSTFTPVQTRANDLNPRTSGFTQPTTQVSYTRESNALGWIKGQYRGYSFMSQDGSLPGYESLSTILPSRQVGAFTAFTGQAGASAYAAKVLVNMFALDLLLHGEPWIEIEDVCDVMSKMTELTQEADSSATSHYPRPGYAGREDELIRPIEDYEGTYRNYAFGDVVVSRNESGKLRLQYGEFGSYILHPSMQNDTFIMQATQGPLWYSTHVEEFRQKGPFLAIFSNHHNDPSQRVETVTIPHFARDMDPEFSKNPTPPRQQDVDHLCDSAPSLAPAVGLISAVLAVLILLC